MTPDATERSAKPGTAVVALGGNALAPAGERSTIADQFRHTRESLHPIVDLVTQGWDVCIVHGNGPQVGDELVRNEVAHDTVEPLPLGVLVAATAGWIGYMVQQSLGNALRAAGSQRAVATIITQIEVSSTDEALVRPTKFVGHELAPPRASELELSGIAVRRDSNGRLRRVVGSPQPVAVHEIGVIQALLDRDVVVVACGGGGVPCFTEPTGALEGVDAVVDKDLAAAVLAEAIGARLLLILTDVDAVYADWGTPRQRRIPRLTVAEASELAAAGAFGEGSMAPKVRGATSYVRRTGGRAIITELSRGVDAVRGTAGTEITADPPPIPPMQST